MTKPFIIPADQPTYIATGNTNELMLLGEWVRSVPVTCARCGRNETFKLVSDDILPDLDCDETLNTYLREHGWHVGDDDICPSCERQPQ